MMSRFFLAVSPLCSAVLLGAASTVVASPNQTAALGAAGDFDLADTLRSSVDDNRYRLRGNGGRTFRDETVRPRVSYSPVEGGPTVELGALGGKGRPRLAHVGVDWSF